MGFGVFFFFFFFKIGGYVFLGFGWVMWGPVDTTPGGLKKWAPLPVNESISLVNFLVVKAWINRLRAS